MIATVNLNFDFTVWDFVLLAAVTLMGTALAYLRHPSWKAFILCLPVPFTVAFLSLGQPVNVTHVLGLFLLLLYTHGVRVLYVNVGLSIVPSIILPAAGYVAAAVALAPVAPKSEAAFWTAAGALAVLSLAMLLATRPRREPGHRTPLPVWIKVPAIAAVVLLIIVGKKMLQGFMTVFPMVGLVAAYEARNSLWTICRAIPTLTLCMLPMMAAIRLSQGHTSPAGALGLGWLVYLAIFLPVTRMQQSARDRA